MVDTLSASMGEGLLDHVGPLVETGLQEKPLSIALREVNAGVLTCVDADEPEAGEQLAEDLSPYDNPA